MFHLRSTHVLFTVLLLFADACTNPQHRETWQQRKQNMGQTSVNSIFCSVCGTLPTQHICGHQCDGASCGRPICSECKAWLSSEMAPYHCLEHISQTSMANAAEHGSLMSMTNDAALIGPLTEPVQDVTQPTCTSPRRPKNLPSSNILPLEAGCIMVVGEDVEKMAAITHAGSGKMGASKKGSMAASVEDSIKKGATKKGSMAALAEGSSKKGASKKGSMAALLVEGSGKKGATKKGSTAASTPAGSG